MSVCIQLDLILGNKADWGTLTSKWLALKCTAIRLTSRQGSACYLWNTVNYRVDDIHALQEIAGPVLVKDAKLQVMTF